MYSVKKNKKRASKMRKESENFTPVDHLRASHVGCCVHKIILVKFGICFLYRKAKEVRKKADFVLGLQEIAHI